MYPGMNKDQGTGREVQGDSSSCKLVTRTFQEIKDKAEMMRVEQKGGNKQQEDEQRRNAHPRERTSI